MRKLGVPAPIALLALASLFGDEGNQDKEAWPDLTVPSQLAKVIDLATPAEKLPVSTKDSQSLVHFPDRSTPYNGWSKKMHANGKIEDLVHYKDGKRDGPWGRWYDNGQCQYQFLMQEGKMMVGKGWKPNGDASPTRIIDGNGLCVGYHSNGRKRFEGMRVKGELEGIVSVWYGNGSPYWQRRYRQGKANGPAKEWVSSSSRVISVSGGTQRIPMNPGKLRKIEGYYKNGLRDGEWLEFDDQGNPMFRTTYRTGSVVKRLSALGD